MKAKTNDLVKLIQTARDMKEQAGRTCNNIALRRVTHTLTSLKRLVNYVTTIRKGTEDNKDFFKAFETALYQCQKGPTSISHDGPHVMHIDGFFDIEMLREFLIVNEPPGMIMLEVKGPKS